MNVKGRESLEKLGISTRKTLFKGMLFSPMGGGAYFYNLLSIRAHLRSFAVQIPCIQRIPWFLILVAARLR